MANTFKSYTKTTVTNSLTDIYTVPSATTSIVIGISLANILDNGNTVYADVKVDKSTGDDVFLIKNAPLYAGAAFTLSDTGKIILETGDKIQAISNTASSVDILVSVLEQT